MVTISGYIMALVTINLISTHANEKQMQNSTSAHQITPCDTKIKNEYGVIKGYWPRLT